MLNICKYKNTYNVFLQEGPYFGKIQWLDGERGVVTVVLDDGDTRHVHVSGYDVKCGAETGDLVEFVLGDDAQHGKVKLSCFTSRDGI